MRFRSTAHGESASHFGIVARLVRVSLQTKKPVGTGIPTGYTFKQMVIDYDRAPSRKKRRLK